MTHVSLDAPGAKPSGAWYRDVTPTQWKAFVGCYLGCTEVLILAFRRHYADRSPVPSNHRPESRFEAEQTPHRVFLWDRLSWAAVPFALLL